MPNAHPGFRIFVLGAGFSRPAGLPLAADLYSLVKNEIEIRYGIDTKFHRDVGEYLNYRRACDGIEIEENEIDLESLMSFWDIEHFLWLRGSDTWSDEGNESQLMTRSAIGKIIQNRTPPKDKLPEAYYRFAESLSTTDIVITFNYDVILERALDYIGKPYRLFPNRYKSIGSHSSTVDSDTEEVVILKLHGSVDWFSNKQFLEWKEFRVSQGASTSNLHSIFDDPGRYTAEPITDGPRATDDPLNNIFRIRNVDSYYQDGRGFHAPFLLSPSHVKFIYASPIIDFWHGLNRAGALNLGLSVIGFSLPGHDEYIRQILYNMVSNYQQYSWNSEIFGVKKSAVKFVDYKLDDIEKQIYKSRFGFSDPSKSEYWFEGFSDESINFLFSNQ
jgi:hypothetical protein